MMAILFEMITRRAKEMYRLFEVALALAVVISAVVLLRALVLPVFILEDEGVKARKPVQRESRQTGEPASAFSVIVAKDLFRPARQAYEPPKSAPKQAVQKAPQPQPLPPPKLALIGTVLRDGSQTAILDYPGGQKGSYYRVGDSIENFVITAITRDTVLLQRSDGASLRVGMRQSVPSPAAQANPPGVSTQPAAAPLPATTPLSFPRLRQKNG